MKHLSRQRRNFRLFTAVLASLMITSAVIFNACSKQETSDPASSAEQPEITSVDQLVLNKILSFKQKMSYVHEHPGYKSGETMSVDSAKWYLDAVFNYSYAYTEQSFESFNRGTFTLTLQKNGDRIDFEEVCEAFNELKQQTLLIYYDTEGEEKELYVSDMSIVENTDNAVVIEVSATIGANTDGTPPEFSQWGPFVEGDDWMYGELLGGCSPGGGIWFGIKDAATEIGDVTNTYRYKYIQDEGPGWYAYYTQPSSEVDVTVYGDITVQDLLRNPHDPNIDNYRDYYLQYQKKELPNLIIETCIPWEDMNFYYHGIRKVIYQIIQENPDEFGVSPFLTFYSCEVEGMRIDGSDYDPNITHHQVSVLYKTRHISGIGGRTSLGDE